MKRVVLTLLVVILALGLFSAVGVAGYRIGFAQGIQRASAGDTSRDRVRPFEESGRERMPMHRFDRGFHRGFGMRGFPMMGMRFFSPVMFLGWVALLGLIGGLIYLVFTRSGWRLTRSAPATESPPGAAETKTGSGDRDPEA